MDLKRFWFQFDGTTPNLPPGVVVGCGVTARDQTHALAILRDHVFAGGEVPAPVSITEDIDISTLDPNHVRPNMGNPVCPGVWFPLVYDPGRPNHL